MNSTGFFAAKFISWLVFWFVLKVVFEEEIGDEDRDKWIVWFDGMSNALGHGVGAILVTPDDQCIPFTARLSFDCTNNMAEHEACALGI